MSQDDELNWKYAWLSHQRKNKYHWEYWVINPHTREALPMPKKYVIEMVCDWRSFSRKWGRKVKSSRLNLTDKIVVHPETRRELELLISPSSKHEAGVLQEGWVRMDPRQIQILCNELELGDLAGPPASLSGGLLHRMYAVQTTTGRYVIKALNPEIMGRPTAMQNFIRSEVIANRAANYVPALPAMQFNGASIQQVGEQFCLVFEWIDGISLKPADINTSHCRTMGSIPSSLHSGDYSNLGIVSDSSAERRLVDWKLYLRRGQQSDAEWVNLLLENIDMLNEWNAEAINSSKLISTDSDMVISHGDLDPKNVLWDLGEPILIDWECAGYRNRKQDLLDTAIYWSENASGEIVQDRLLAFFDGYKGAAQERIQADWRMILACGFTGKLDWLEYNLKRSLWIDCTNQDEQKIGTEQVTGTLFTIKRYAEKVDEIKGWLTEI